MFYVVLYPMLYQACTIPVLVADLSLTSKVKHSMGHAFGTDHQAYIMEQCVGSLTREPECRLPLFAPLGP